MTWTAPEITRDTETIAEGERTSLDWFLDFHRETLLWKCQGLTSEQLASRPLGTTTLSLLGILRHLSLVERGWFRQRFAGDAALPDLYVSEEFPDGEFDLGTPETAEADYAIYLAEIDAVRKTVAGRSLDDTFTGNRGQVFSLRWVYLHMIEEYARHNGHADLLREAIDGVTGE